MGGGGGLEGWKGKEGIRLRKRRNADSAGVSAAGVAGLPPCSFSAGGIQRQLQAEDVLGLVGAVSPS